MNRRRRTGLLALVLAAGAPLVWASSSPAQQTGPFTAVASGNGVRSTSTSPGFLIVEELTDAGGPTAQALVDSLGNSKGFAAYPYPGSTALAAPGVAGQSEQVSYPLIATSSYPDQEESSAGGDGYSLKATSAESASDATAQGGSSGDEQQVGLSRATASASMDPASGTVRAQAASTVEAAGFADVLRIGRVHASASVELPADGPPKLESDLQVGQVSVAGTAVGFTPDGLVLAGSTTPLAETPFGDVLRESGVSVRYLAPRVDEDGHGVVSAGVEVTVARNLTGSGATTIVHTFGQASARAMADLAASPGSETVVTPVADGASSVPQGGTASTPAPVTSPSFEDAPSGSIPDVDEAPSRAPGGAPPGLASSSVPDVSSVSFYLVLVVAAFAALGGAQLIRILGVRLAWTS